MLLVDGLARYHKYEIRDGRVLYRSRDGAEDVEKEIKKTGRYPGVAFGQKTDPCERSTSNMYSLGSIYSPTLLLHVVWRKFFTVFETPIPISKESNSNFNVCVTPAFDQSWGKKEEGAREPVTVMTDANALKTIDPETLESRELFDYSRIHPQLSGPCSAAHSCT